MKSRLAFFVVTFALLSCIPYAQQFAGTAAQGGGPSPSSLEQVIQRIVEREKKMVETLADYTPFAETYIQHLDLHDELGTAPKGDKYFLGKLSLRNGVGQSSLLRGQGFASKVKDALTRFFSVRYVANGFAQMMFVDDKGLDPGNYDFTYVRREFLGEVRCLVFDVQPKPDKKRAAFRGRIWAEDQGFHIVRFNGTYVPSSANSLYFHFDSWRENMGPGLWLPAYVYIEESDFGYFFGRRSLRFKGQTRIWGYDVNRGGRQDEFTTLTVESDEIQDAADAPESISPLESFRAWERQAENNMLDRLQKASLLAPEGEVDQVLETVTNNIEITNNLNIQPPVRARVLLTSPFETFTVGHTIVISRGLIDVLPDEASLAMFLAHELAHIALGHRLDTKHAFNDRMLFEDEDIFSQFSVKRDPREEEAADKKAAELLGSSPYKDKLGNAGLFLRALDDRAAELTNLVRPHIGNFVARNGKIRRMTEMMKAAPALEMKRTDQIAALPLGGRVRMDPWDNSIELIKSKPVELLSPREKMPFEVSPVFLYLTRVKTVAN